MSQKDISCNSNNLLDGIRLWDETESQIVMVVDEVRLGGVNWISLFFFPWWTHWIIFFSMLPTVNLVLLTGLWRMGGYTWLRTPTMTLSSTQKDIMLHLFWYDTLSTTVTTFMHLFIWNNMVVNMLSVLVRVLWRWMASKTGHVRFQYPHKKKLLEKIKSWNCKDTQR